MRSLESETPMVRVWDPLVRIFHWSLVSAFLIAYLTEDDLMSLHSYAGYTVLGLIGIRILWGLIGTRHARFTDFVRSPRTVKNYLTDVIRNKAKRHLGHNPAGGAMVMLLLLSLIATGVTGMLIYGIEEHAGPLANWVQHWPHSAEDIFEELHEFFANFTLFLVFIHVAGVVLASFQHHENLVRSMWNGKKRTETNLKGELS